MNILITGGSGFIGRNLVNFFKKNNQVFSPGRKDLMLKSASDVENYIVANNIDIVIHCAFEGISAGIFSEAHERSVYDNLKMFENLALNRDKFKLMINYGSGASEDFSNSPYALAKFIIDRRVEQIRDNIVSIRLWGCTGEDEKDHRFIQSCINRLLQGKQAVIYQDRLFDFVTINDVCRITDNYISSISEEDAWFAVMPKILDFVPLKKEKLTSIANKVDYYVKYYNGENFKLQPTESRFLIKSEKMGLPYVGDGVRLNSLYFKLDSLEKHIEERVINALRQRHKVEQDSCSCRGICARKAGSGKLEQGRLGKVLRAIFRRFRI
jgi:UDP-glucose 4-epimerase